MGLNLSDGMASRRNWRRDWSYWENLLEGSGDSGGDDCLLLDNS